MLIYARNVPSFDDWNVVPLVDAALHSHLTLTALCALHNENRMLFPNLVMVCLCVFTLDNLTW